MTNSLISQVDAVARSGKTVISADDETIVALVKMVIETDQSASFYLSRPQAAAIREWYWTPERTRFTGIRPISAEEELKIRSELDLQLTNFRYAPIECRCGHVYGAYDFLAQGIRQHGIEAVKAIFSLKDSTFFQVNPTFLPVCPDCDRELSMMARSGGGGWYDCDEYGGCCCCAAMLDAVSLQQDGARPQR